MSRGQWISGNQTQEYTLEFCKEFTLDYIPKTAKLSISGLGYFDATVNEQPLDDIFYKPPLTDYNTRNYPENPNIGKNTGHRVTYYTYDVTRYLQAGTNILTAEVAGGYYTYKEKENYEPNMFYSFGEQKLWFELEIDNNLVLFSDEDTLVRQTNRKVGLFSREEIDFTKPEKDFEKAYLAKQPDGKLVQPQCEGDRICEIYEPKEVYETEEGTIYDFGKNHSGGLRLSVWAKEETELIIRYAEICNEDGSLNFETGAWHGKNETDGTPKDIYQENRYRLKKGRYHLEPRFNWLCYRYALIEKNDAIDIESIESLFIHTDLKKESSFACSEEIFNQINDTFLQTVFSNMHSGIIMDCPHREKLPYTGDGKLVMKSVCYNLQAVDLYRKWFQDLLDSQREDGYIPNSAPYMGGGGGYAWGNAICTVTKLLYQFTGDEQVLKDGYPAILKWIRFYDSHCTKEKIIYSNSQAWMLGDWLAPDITESNVPYISTMCYLEAVKIAIEVAGILKLQDVNDLKRLEEEIIDGVNRTFFDRNCLSYGNGVQGEDVLALAMNIVPNEYVQALKDKVEHHYRVETAYHLDTGIVLTPILIEYLTEHGYGDIAYKIMTSKTYPSYYNLMDGDTTFPEHWSKKWPDYYTSINDNCLIKGGGDLSHCHPMYGSVCSWLYERVAGLDLTGLWKKEVGIHPYFTDCLTWAKADKIISYGKVSVEWKKDAKGLLLEFQIPEGLTGRVEFPSNYQVLVNQGTGERYLCNAEGMFSFSVCSGNWTFITEKQEKYI